MRKLHDKHYARGNQAYEMMLNSLEEGECGLCTFSVHPKPILNRVGEGTFNEWLITERHELPKGVEHYLLIIPKRHIVDWDEEMNEVDDRMVRALVRWARQSYNLKGYGLAIRSGDSHWTGATARHLHYHLIVPQIDPATGRAIPYYFPIG